MAQPNTSFGHTRASAGHIGAAQGSRCVTSVGAGGRSAGEYSERDGSRGTGSAGVSGGGRGGRGGRDRVDASADLPFNLHDVTPLILDEHAGPVTRVRAPAKTNLLLSSSVDGTVRIWDRDCARCRAVLDTAGFGQALNGQQQTLYPDSRPERRITLGASSSVDAGDEDASLGGDGGAGTVPRAIKVLNVWAEDSCESIWAACSDHAVRVWSGGEGRPQRIMKGHDEAITALEGIDPGSSNASGGSMLQTSSSLVATASVDRTVRVWDCRAKKAQMFLFRGHGDTPLALRWGEGGRSLVSSGKDKTVKIWDTRAGR